VPVGPQGIGETKGVEAVALAAGGRLAVAEALGGLGVERKDCQSRFEQSFDSRAATGLDGEADDDGRSVRGLHRRELAA